MANKRNKKSVSKKRTQKMKINRTFKKAMKKIAKGKPKK